MLTEIRSDSGGIGEAVVEEGGEGMARDKADGEVVDGVVGEGGVEVADELVQHS